MFVSKKRFDRVVENQNERIDYLYERIEKLEDCFDVKEEAAIRTTYTPSRHRCNKIPYIKETLTLKEECIPHTVEFKKTPVTVVTTTGCSVNDMLEEDGYNIKACIECGKLRPNLDFNLDGRTLDGLSLICNHCKRK